MPIIKIYTPNDSIISNEVLDSISQEITTLLKLPPNHVWIFVHTVEKYIKPDWKKGENAPVVMVYCKNTYEQKQVEDLIRIINSQLINAFNCCEDKVYISVIRIQPNHLFVRGDLWSE